MTGFLSPVGNQGLIFFIPGTITPANGGQLFFYVNKSSTKQTVYKDEALGTAWTNPIVLDAGGAVPLGGEIWFPQGQIFTIVFAPSNDTDPPASPYWSKDDQSGMNDVSSLQSEWTPASTPSFVSASQFTMAGDQTAVGSADVGRRMKFTVTAGTVYGTISARSFGAGVTTVTVDMDGAQLLDSGLSAAFYSILSATNDAVPLIPGGRSIFMDPTDNTKQAALSLVNISTGTIRTYTLPDVNDTLVTVSTGVLFNPTFNGVASGSALASKAAMSSNSGLIPTVSSVAFHPGVAAAWGKADATGNLSEGYQILSVTDLAVGRIEFNLSTSAFMATNTFAPIFSYQNATSATGQAVYAQIDQARPPTISTIALVMVRTDGTTPVPFDPNNWTLAVFGRIA